MPSAPQCATARQAVDGAAIHRQLKFSRAIPWNVAVAADVRLSSTQRSANRCSSFQTQIVISGIANQALLEVMADDSCPQLSHSGGMVKIYDLTYRKPLVLVLRYAH